MCLGGKISLKDVEMANRPIYLYITPFFPSPETWRGGYCLDAVKALIRLEKYDVRVMVPSKGEDYIWDGISISRIRRVSAPCGLVPFLFGWINKRFFKKKLKEIGISLDRIAVCHSNTFDCANYAVALKQWNPKVKTLLHHHCSYGVDLRAGRLGRLPIHSTLLYFYYRMLSEQVNAHVFCSEMSRRTFGKYFVTAPEGEVLDVRRQLLFGRWMRDWKMPESIVLYNGVDTSVFHPKTNRPQNPNSFVIGCVANFQPLKGQLTLLKAVNLVKEKIAGLYVRLVGSGEMLSVCKNYVEREGLSDFISFEREIDHRELPEFYRSLDLFVLPSRLEGFCCVYMECHACGTPVIGCKGVSLEEVIPIEVREQWLANPNDSKSLAEKILGFYKARPQQTLFKQVDIDVLMRDFVNEIEAMRG